MELLLLNTKLAIFQKQHIDENRLYFGEKISFQNGLSLVEIWFWIQDISSA